MKNLKRLLPIVLAVAGLAYAVCCSNSASDYVVSGYAHACITCNWEGDGLVYLEKSNPYFLCPGGEWYGYAIVDANGVGARGVARMGQAVYKYIPLAQSYVSAGVTWQGCTSTRPSTTVFCSGLCGR